MRLFLSLFRLPGESQQIERILEAFAHVYFSDNPADFENEEEVYVLAFSFIILNTLTFNKNVAESRKMKREDFVRLNKQALKRMPSKTLGRYYDEIVSQEFKTHIEGS